MTFAASWRSSFVVKAGVAVVLVALADGLFFAHRAGTTFGIFALIAIVGLVIVRRDLVRDRRAVLALGLAGLLALTLIDQPGVLGWWLYALAITIAAMSARVATGEPGWRWMQRLVVHTVVATAGPVIDLARWARIRRERSGTPTGSVMRVMGLIALPVFGGAVFLALFASANPIIADVLSRLKLPPLSLETVSRAMFWMSVAMAVWAALRPRWRGKLLQLPSIGARGLPGVSAASVTLSLIVFNMLFAVQNILDVTFLWSGAPLPEGATLASYAHRGAYPLIVTALLAGAFVLVTLRPGSETATRPLVRRLVMIWVAQNMLLVASSLLRTADYVEVFSLTRFRLAAMIWMVLVGLGLMLICWRLMRNRSAHWLIDTNLMSALAVLAVIGTTGLGPAVAAWNVRHSAEVDGTGAALDLCYLRQLGPSALVALAELESQTTQPVLKDRISAVRWQAQSDMMGRQSAWRGWTWRDARRLAKAQSLVGMEAPQLGTLERECDGRVITPPPPVPTVVISHPAIDAQPLAGASRPDSRPAIAGPGSATPLTSTAAY
jgi:hypothetical protein